MIAEKICWEDLLRKSAEKICWEDLLRRSAEKICWEDLLRRSAEKICWEDLLRIAVLRRFAEKICWEWLWIKTSLEFLSFFYAGWVWLTKTGDHPLVTSCSSDVQNCGEMRSLHFFVATLSSLRARRTSKTEVKCEVCTSSSQPSRHFVLVGPPKLRWNANLVLWQPSRRFVLIGRPKLWWNANFDFDGATLSSLRAGQMSETVVKWWFLYAAGCPGRRALDSYIFAHAAVVKRTFWNFGWRAVVARRTFCFCWMNPLVGFGGSIARNCGEMQIFSGNCRKHRAKRSFWKYCSMKFGGSLARKARFGSLFC